MLRQSAARRHSATPRCPPRRRWPARLGGASRKCRDRERGLHRAGGRVVSEPFHLASERSQQTQQISSSGELDIATVPHLDAAFDAALATDAKHILIDLAGISFIDSTGLRLLIRMKESCEDGRLSIRSNAVVDRLLQVTGLADQLPLIPYDAAPPV